MTSRRNSPFARCVSKFIARFPELKYDGTVIYCCTCKANLMGWTPYKCRRHIESGKHRRNRELGFTYGTFLYDFIFMCSVCGIPQYILDQQHFRVFWKKYIPHWPLPTRRQLAWRFRHVKELIERNIQRELHEKTLWLCIDETRDPKNNRVGNVLVRVLDSSMSSKLYLLASKKLDSPDAMAVEKLIMGTLAKFNIRKRNVLMLVTNDSPYMIEVGWALKYKLPNLLHITCLLQGVHLVSETLRNCYPEVDELITSTKRIFVKSTKRVKEFQKACPRIPDPPQPVYTRWATWLQAAFYYIRTFDTVKAAISKFDFKDAYSIGQSQQLFASPQIKTDLDTIGKNYEVLLGTIEKLQSSSLSVGETFHIIDNLSESLQTLTDNPGIRAAEKFKELLHNNPDYVKLRVISDKLHDGVANDFQKDFAYANVTALDTERLFSKYSATLSSQRISLSADTVEGILMMQVYSETRKRPLMDGEEEDE